MPTRNDALKERLSRVREIEISVTGRKSGRTITIPVWFVLEEEKIYLLPVQGSDTQWYRNVLKKPSIRVSAGGAAAELKAVPSTDAAQVSAVVENGTYLAMAPKVLASGHCSFFPFFQSAGGR